MYWGDEAAAQYRTLQAYDSLLTPEVPIHVNLAWDSLRGGRPEAIEVLTSGLPADESLAASLIENANFGIQLREVTT